MLDNIRLSSQGAPEDIKVYQTQTHTHQARWHVPARFSIYPPAEIYPEISILRGMEWNMNNWTAAQWAQDFSTTGTDDDDCCPTCHTKFKADPAPYINAFPTGGNTLTSMTFATQQFPWRPTPTSDAIASASPISVAPASAFSTPVVAGGGYDQAAGIVESRQELPNIQTDLHQHYSTQTVPSMISGGMVAGNRSIRINNDGDDNNNKHNTITHGQTQPTSPGSNGNSPSDQSSPNESNGIKRKRSKNKEQPARYVRHFYLSSS